MFWFLFSLKGRLNRAFYWYGTVLLIAIYFIAGYVAEELLKRLVDMYSAKYAVWTAFGLVAWPIFAINVKRCHDFNRPWPLALLAFIPIVDVPYGFLMFLVRGTEGPNRYGDDPCYRPFNIERLNRKLEKKLQKSWPIRTEELSDELLSRIKHVHSALSEVEDEPLEEWIEGFKCDKYPELSIQGWEYILLAYDEYCSMQDLTPVERKDVYKIIICYGIMNKEQIINQCSVRAISEGQMREVLEICDEVNRSGGKRIIEVKDQPE